jgi:hypothetical protein
MSFIEEVMQRSQFTIVVITAVLLIVGLPRNRGRYGILAAVLAVLSIVAALQWHANYTVGIHHFRDEAHWPYFILSALFVIAAGLLVWEFVSLRLFRRLTLK